MLEVIPLMVITVFEKPLIEVLVQALSRSAASHRHSFL
jgi:hypothetical protein